MFTLLSGELVHVAESSSEHLVKAATLHARSVARVLPGVPANVETLVGRAMRFEKKERWASATEMRRELWRVRLDPGRPIGTTSAPPPRNPSSNFPTVVGKRDSDKSGLRETGMSLTGEVRRDPASRRAVFLSTVVAVLLVASALTFGIYIDGAEDAARETHRRRYRTASLRRAPAARGHAAVRRDRREARHHGHSRCAGCGHGGDGGGGRRSGQHDDDAQRDGQVRRQHTCCHDDSEDDECDRQARSRARIDRRPLQAVLRTRPVRVRASEKAIFSGEPPVQSTPCGMVAWLGACFTPASLLRCCSRARLRKRVIPRQRANR